MEFISNSVGETKEFGKKIGRLLSPGNVVGLFGSLATGKTVLTKGILKGMGMKNIKFVRSPSFIIIQQYTFMKKNKEIPVYHFDLYRLDSIKEIEDLGWNEFLDSEGICIIEWAQKAENIMPHNYLKVELYIENRSSRRLCVIPKGEEYADLATKLSVFG